jgi:hypothetical protein
MAMKTRKLALLLAAALLVPQICAKPGRLLHRRSKPLCRPKGLAPSACLHRGLDQGEPQ